MAIHMPITEMFRGATPVTLIPSARKAIEAEIERLIELLDTIDGDCDLEDDDPAGGNVEDEGEFDMRVCSLLPVFGADQTQPPINMVELHADQRAQEDRLFRADNARWQHFRFGIAA